MAQLAIAISRRQSEDSPDANVLSDLQRIPPATMIFGLTILCLGLAVGIAVGLLGIGGGVVLVPAMVYLLHFDQHMAQGTSLFILLPPIGLGELRGYWKNGNVDLRVGTYCAIG